MEDQQKQLDTGPVAITLPHVPTTLGLHPRLNPDVDMISPCPPDILEDLVSQLLISNASTSTQTDLHLPPFADIKIIIQPTQSGSSTKCVNLTPPPSPIHHNTPEDEHPPKRKKIAYCNYCKRKGHLIDELAGPGIETTKDEALRENAWTNKILTLIIIFCKKGLMDSDS